MGGRFADEFLHRGERFGGLGGPAPLAVGRGVGDGLKFPPGVGAAKLVDCPGEQVIGRPGVMHGDAGE